ncbi:MAG TPA: glycosyltransferase [Solirubrobacteraceae bacterium]|jgi:serine acetyltransferase/GT2 family glycosyltransferase
MNAPLEPRPAASVVVASYQRPAEIARLLGQLDAQDVTNGSFEVIVVDDGSASDLRAVLAAADHRFPLTVLRQEHAGAAAARQLGVGAARAELLVFVDDDMHIGSQFVAAHLAAHRQGDRLVVLGRRRAGSAGVRLPLDERYRLTAGDRLANDVAAGLELTGEYVYTGNVSIPRALFEETGGFDSSMLELNDTELGIRLGRAGARFVLSDAAFNVHERDPLPVGRWFERAQLDGRYWVALARKHPDVPAASPWHWLEIVHPASRPLLLAGALAPRATGVLARALFAGARVAGAVGLESAAMAGATVVYSVNLFRGVGEEAGGAMRAWREFRVFARGRSSGGRDIGGALRQTLAAIGEDHRLLLETNARYDSRERRVGSAARAFIENAGFQLVVLYRVMRFMRLSGHPLVARVLSRTIRLLHGSDVHWDAELAPGIVVVHGFGLAISYAARTGPGCILFQQVTLGVGHDAASGAAGAPTLREQVVVGPGAVLTGPITIGARTKIMANCVVAASVPADTIVEAPPVTLRPR